MCLDDLWHIIGLDSNAFSSIAMPFEIRLVGTWVRLLCVLNRFVGFSEMLYGLMSTVSYVEI